MNKKNFILFVFGAICSTVIFMGSACKGSEEETTQTPTHTPTTIPSTTTTPPVTPPEKVVIPDFCEQVSRDTGYEEGIVFNKIKKEVQEEIDAAKTKGRELTKKEIKDLMKNKLTSKEFENELIPIYEKIQDLLYGKRLKGSNERELHIRGKCTIKVKTGENEICEKVRTIYDAAKNCYKLPKDKRTPFMGDPNKTWTQLPD